MFSFLRPSPKRISQGQALPDNAVNIMHECADTHCVTGNATKGPWPEHLEVLVVGMGCFWGAWKARDGNRGNRKNMHEMLRLVASGALKPLVSKSYGLDRFADAFDDIMSRRVVGKITIRVNEPSRL